jgi:hypothetical protein
MDIGYFISVGKHDKISWRQYAKKTDFHVIRKPASQ